MNFFNEDNVVNIFFNRLGDIIIANLLFILCSIPIVTIGPSLSALYYCMLRIAKGNSSGVTKSFFHSFRQNFKQALIIWLIFLLLLIILLLDIRFLASVESSMAMVLSYCSAAVLVLLVIGFLYIFPVIAAFSNTLKNLLKNAYIFAFSHFPSTLAIAVISILPMYMTYQDLELLPLYAFCWFFFGFGLTALINSYMFYRIFKPYLEESA